MSLLVKATNQTAYLKAGLLGFQGSGKTRTATELAVGLAKEVGNGKPIAFFDTETGSDYMIPICEKAGVELLVAKTRSFRDLLTFMREAEAQCSVAIIDSITHVWKELMESYQKKLNRRYGLQFQDWGKLKGEWGQFTDVYVNSQLHVILCGRAGWDYDTHVDADSGKKELIKAGTKMKAESEMGYEPSLLLEMERVREDSGVGGGWINRCHVLKDRTDTMNGKSIDFPAYKDFAPVVSFLNIGGTHVGVDTESTSEDLFDSPDWSRTERKRQIEILGEKLKEALILADLDGSAAKTKKARVKALLAAFGTSSWTELMEMHPKKLGDGLLRLRIALGQAEEPKKLADEGGSWVDGDDDEAPESETEATEEAA